MPGAYTAKPDAAVEPPDVPDGWDVDWPFGDDGEGGWYPYPPGYTPAFSLNLSATESISYDGAATAMATLRDHVTYGTIEPAGCQITWTATISGEAVNLRFSGDEDYESSLSLDYSEVGDYWGAVPDIEFELTGDNDGDVITLKAASTVSGAAVSTTAEVSIATVVTLEIPFVYSIDNEDDSVELNCYMAMANPASEDFYEPDFKGSRIMGMEFLSYDDPGSVEDVLTGSVDADGIHAEITLANIEEEQYLFLILSTYVYESGEISATATLTVGSEEYTKTISGNSADIVWLRIYRNGSVTVITP